MISLDTSQTAAVEAALSGGDRVITGGAGTGKTTIIKTIAEQLDRRCVIVAPTGKAAARIRESTGFEAGTIHRELAWDGTAFLRREQFNVPVIIDESSMVDSWLMAKLLSFQPPKLILVGDTAQLPPVGRGQPFHDLVALRRDLVSTLTTCHRAKGAVHIAASAIREGKAPEARMESGGEVFRLQDTGGPEQTMAVLASWIKKGSLNPQQDVIVAPQYGSADAPSQQMELGGSAIGTESDGGIHAINRLAKSILNPAKAPDEKWRPGDRVLICKNFGKDDLWNGDLGTITAVDTKGLPYVLLDRDKQRAEDLEDARERHLTVEQARETTLAYCLSVHKAQGSQFRRVFFVCFRRHAAMLSRSLIYTAITRAREGCVVMGELSAFYRGLNVRQERKTVMQWLAGGANVSGQPRLAGTTKET